MKYVSDNVDGSKRVWDSKEDSLLPELIGMFFNWLGRKHDKK